MRFHLFAGDTYYGHGPMNDYQASFDSLEEALTARRVYTFDGTPEDFSDQWHRVLVQNADGNLELVHEDGEIY